ncbi:E3 ubiquitin-protein ligase IPI1-like isoform X2 [Apium graveolens]|uniref:E3 ubiquitin-protein ligase IPI1-like isoform X2 n=1 Tax=Apium graveolens TaxID=4045 RepID=UPI003D7A6248
MDSVIAANMLLLCSICLESISDHEERSVAKLKCGHKFHLDCIGSAFNMEGAMLCPNCGDVEDGSWLYANASTSSSPDFSINDREYSSFPDFSIDDWEWEDLYDYLFADDLSTFNGMTGDSSFEQVESSPTPNRELVGSHALFAEHMAASPMAHPHVHVPPIPNAISRATNVQYQSGGRHLPSLSANRNLLNGVEHVLDPSTMRNTRVDSDAILRSGPSALPFLYGDSSFPGGGSLIVSSLNHPGSITYPHERIQVSHVGHPPQGNPTSLLPTIMPGASRFSGPIGMPVSTPAPPQEISNIFPYPGSQNLHLENRNRLSRFPVMPFDRESGWDPERQWYGGADPSQRSGNFWPEWP